MLLRLPPILVVNNCLELALREAAGAAEECQDSGHRFTTAAARDRGCVTARGAERVLDYQTDRFEDSLNGIDAVLDTVGGETQQRSLQVLKAGGTLVSAVSPLPEDLQWRYNIRAAYFYVDVTMDLLDKITRLFKSGQLVTDVGTVLPLEKASPTRCSMVLRVNGARSC